MKASAKILYVLQQSVYNNDGKWVSADSNINMMVGMLKEMAKLKPHWHFHVLISPIDSFADVHSYSDIYDGHNCTFIEYPFPVNAFTNRYNFDTILFAKILNHVKPDVVWNNICELTRNMKTVARQEKSQAKFVTGNYWMDCPFINEPKVSEDITYFWRQLDGYLCSDVPTFTCKSTLKAFVDNAKHVVNDTVINEVLKKCTIFDFGYSAAEIKAYAHLRGIVKADHTLVGFLNRLSGINYTHHKEFIDACNNTTEKFDVWFSNPSQKVEPDFLRLSMHHRDVHTDNTTPSRDKYLLMLHRMDISVHLYTLERYGGCAVREAIAANNLIIAPRVHEYAAILGDDYQFYVKDDLSNISQVIESAAKFCKAAKHDKTKYLSPDILRRNALSSFEVVSMVVAETVEKLL